MGNTFTRAKDRQEAFSENCSIDDIAQPLLTQGQSDDEISDQVFKSRRQMERVSQILIVLAGHKEALTNAERKIATLRTQGFSDAQTTSLSSHSFALSLDDNDRLQFDLIEAYQMFRHGVKTTSEHLNTWNFLKRTQIHDAKQIRHLRESLEISWQNYVDLKAEHKECCIKSSHQRLLTGPLSRQQTTAIE